MCGIAGIMTVNAAAPDAAALEAMKAVLAHRGPDGDAVWTSGDTGLVHTRLAIIDLETGDQPLFGPGGAALVANGEIYNYRSLRKELGHTGAFYTDCEAEVLARLYSMLGEAMPEKLDGMFAFVIFSNC